MPTMSANSRLLSALCLVSCLLTLAASGDDICLPTIALGSLASHTDLLPLDDPNSDFLEVTACVVELRQGCLGGLAVVAEPRPNAAPPTPADGALLRAGVLVKSSLSRAELSPFLRC
jgi:hypothetical protein